MDITLQIERLEAINCEIEAGIRLDKLDTIQTLVDERKSRIAQLIELQRSGKANVFSQFFDRLSSIQEGGDNLGRLMELKLKVIGNELRKTGDAQVISKGYTKGPVLAAAENRRTTDITG